MSVSERRDRAREAVMDTVQTLRRIEGLLEGRTPAATEVILGALVGAWIARFPWEARERALVSLMASARGRAEIEAGVRSSPTLRPL